METTDLMTGELLELNMALENGALWGDIVLDYEERELKTLRDKLKEMIALSLPGRWRIARDITRLEATLPWCKSNSESQDSL
jgi:hypothetical protein